MKRRTMLRKLGAAGIATTALSGSAVAAERPADLGDLGVDRDIDVSSVDGQVSLAELLEPGDVESLADDVDPSAHTLTVAPEADVIALDDCCESCCHRMKFVKCTCDCCVCDASAC